MNYIKQYRYYWSIYNFDFEQIIIAQQMKYSWQLCLKLFLSRSL